jgi:hypothetical protein
MTLQISEQGVAEVHGQRKQQIKSSFVNEDQNDRGGNQAAPRFRDASLWEELKRIRLSALFWAGCAVFFLLWICCLGAMAVRCCAWVINQGYFN